MTTPFDPTTNDRKEWDRLAASKWLPPIMQKEIKSDKSISTATIVQPEKKQVSSKFRRLKLESNVCTRFIKKLKMRALYLEELAIFLEGMMNALSIAKEKQDAESMERKWTLAKQLSKSSRFLNYIHSLEERAKSLEEGQSISTRQAKQVDMINDPPQIEALELKNSMSGQKASEHKSFYDLREAIASSPFKPKEKSLKRIIVGNDEELTYDFSKPSNTSEDVNVEFGRTFRDIYQIGSVAKEKWSKALVDKKAFSVRRPNDSVELSNSKHEVTKNNLESKKQMKNTNYDRFQNPAFKNSMKFNILREEEHTKLLGTLENRKKDRFNRSKNLKTVQPVFKLIDSDMRKHTSRRQNSIWKDTLPNMWVEDPYNLHNKISRSILKGDPEIINEKPQKSKVKFGQVPANPVPTETEMKAKLGWSKLKSVARFNGLNRMPLGPRTSIAVPNASETMRSEIMNLMTN